MNTKNILSLAGIAMLFFLVSTTYGQTYSMPGGTVSTCSGNFYDTGGSGGNYVSNQNITTVFCPSTAGSYLSFNFTSLDIHLNYDFLYIYDGNSTAAPLIGIYTGTSSPGTVTASSLNPTGCITFRFISNAWGTNPGWAATVSCSATPGAPSIAAQNGSFSVCGGTFTDPGGNGVYQFNTDVTTTLCPSVAGQYVSAAFSSFQLDNDFNDWLYVYDGNSTASPLIGMFNNSMPGMATTPGVITASADNPTGCLTFRFISDPWDVFAGWKATLSCTSTPATPSYSISPGTVTTCGASFTDVGGATNDYNGPHNITNTFCPATPGQVMSVTFSSLSMSVSSREDCLYIYDGSSTAAPLIGIYSDNFNPGTITASTNNPSGCLTFRFVCDPYNPHPGWVATLSCAAPVAPSFAINNSTLNICNATFTDDGGANGDYYFNMSTTTTSTQTFCPVNAGDCIRATFSSFNIEGYVDYLRAYDGTSTAAPLLGTWTSTNSPGTINATTANTSGCLTFQFTNSSWTATAGWNAAISCNCTGLPVTMLSFTGEWVEDDVLLRWSTATETNNEYFVVERSADGITFEQLGQVGGMGTLAVQSDYSFVDEHPLEGISYYRLMQVDHDGQAKYSSIVSLEKLAGNEIITGALKPNPAADEVSFTVTSAEEAEMKLSIVNELGIIVDEKQLDVARGKNEFYLPLMQLSPGVYHLLIVYPHKGNISIQKLIKI